EDLAQPEPVIDACYKLAPDISLHLAEIAFIRILQGRLDEAVSLLDEAQGESRNVKRTRIDLAATRAFVATLRADDEEAIRSIQAAIDEEKAGTRKRNVFPDARAFVLSLLALLRCNTPGCLALLEQLMRVGHRKQAWPHLVELVAHAAGLKDLRRYQMPAFDNASLYTLLYGFLYCWVEETEMLDGNVLARLGYRARLHGFKWVEAERLELTRRHSVGRQAEEAAAKSVELHAETGTATLVSLVTPMPDWEYPLKEIEMFAFETRTKRKSAPKQAAPASQRRLVWDFSNDRYLGVSVTPREQRANKNGSWSKGRSVAMKRLQEDMGTMDFLLEQDRAAIATIKRDTYGRHGHDQFYLPPAGLYALAGHPYIFNADGGQVDLARREPELSVEEQADGMILARVEPHGRHGEDPVYHVRVVGKRRCEVTRFTPGHQRLFAIIPPKGLALPAPARARLLDAVSDLATEIRVQGVISDNAPVQQVDADSQPWVKLEPKGAGLVAELVVEPVPRTGNYFEPGRGGTTIFANCDGETVQARRDLKAERAAVEELTAACPLLAVLRGKQRSLTLPDPVACLELLEQTQAAGARCLWPGAEPLKIVARADTAALKLSVKSAADWFRASGQLNIDDDRVLDLRQLFALLDKNPGARFLELKDGEFIALTDSFRRQLDDLRSLSVPAGEGSVRLHPLAALSLQDFVEQTRLDAAKSWRDQCARLREAQAVEARTPSTLQAELRPYQLEGFRWLARLSHWGAGACLADDMGLGKTVQTLALLLQRAPDGPALVVAPTSVVANWMDEARRFAPTLEVIPYTGAAAARAQLLDTLGPFNVVVTSYGVLHADATRLAEVAWHSAVLDEAQAIRNPATKRARAARTLKADFRLVTTGTPIQNNLVDLYSLFGFINPGMLGPLEQYRRNFALPIEKDADADARARLRRVIAPFVLRRLKSEVLNDLPARTEIILHVDMSREEAALYEALRQRAVEDLEALAGKQVGEGEHKLQVLAHLTRLRLACCNPRLVREADAADTIPASSKLETFAETLDELLANRHKILVFSQFVKHLKLVEERLAETGVAYQYLDGATPAGARAKRIAAFQAGQGDVFLISLKAGGVGLNLTAADYVIHMDPWWNPAAEDQASDRAHRIGQTRPVTIYRLVTKGTIEEQIVELHHHKRDLADRLLEGADAPARLNAKELLNLLRQPAT
ncbi:MAG: DEAD/DEAH box helicase, partial [Gammaproteobacteria bacterium]|nr:DEAD/DEAH box helicase [Gammaproteobacteria bacterium]